MMNPPRVDNENNLLDWVSAREGVDDLGNTHISVTVADGEAHPVGEGTHRT